jgi:hypothetical protein
MTKLVTQLLRLAQQFTLTKQFRNKKFFTQKNTIKIKYWKNNQ